MASDHAPILLNTHLERENLHRPFRFFEAWTAEPDCREVIRLAWQRHDEGHASYVLNRKTIRTRIDLKTWSRGIFHRNQQRLHYLERKLISIQNNQPSQENLSRESAVLFEIEEIMDQMEKFWKQK